MTCWVKWRYGLRCIACTPAGTLPTVAFHYRQTRINQHEHWIFIGTYGSARFDRVMKLANALLSFAGATSSKRSVQAVSSVDLGSGNGKRYSNVVCSMICLEQGESQHSSAVTSGKTKLTWSLAYRSHSMRRRSSSESKRIVRWR